MRRIYVPRLSARGQGRQVARGQVTQVAKAIWIKKRVTAANSSNLCCGTSCLRFKLMVNPFSGHFALPGFSYPCLLCSQYFTAYPSPPSSCLQHMLVLCAAHTQHAACNKPIFHNPQAVLHDLESSHPRLLSELCVVMAEMERLTVTWEERWAGLLGEAEVDVARRCVALAAEAARVADNATLSSPQKQAILADR